jgi:cobalt-zinc-cadmium efflux system outer membrane protein
MNQLLEARIIEATELTLQRKATDATLASQSALLELNQLRGQPWANATKVAPVNLAFTAAPETDVLLAGAQTNNFELQMRRLELEPQGFKVALARKDGYTSKQSRRCLIHGARRWKRDKNCSGSPGWNSKRSKR